MNPSAQPKGNTSAHPTPSQNRRHRGPRKLGLPHQRRPCRPSSRSRLPPSSVRPSDSSATPSKARSPPSQGSREQHSSSPTVSQRSQPATLSTSTEGDSARQTRQKAPIRPSSTSGPSARPTRFSIAETHLPCPHSSSTSSASPTTSPKTNPCAPSHCPLKSCAATTP